MSGAAVVVEVTGQAGRIAGRQASTDAQVLSLWLHAKSRNTARAYAREAEAFSSFVGGAPLSAVTLGDVQAYAEALTARGLAPATVARALAALKSLLAFAHRIGYVPVNVGAAEPLPKRKDTLAERIVDRETVARIIGGECDTRNRALLRVLYFGGLRESEACGLHWSDVQAREGGAVQLTVYGKGAKTRAVLLPPAFAAELAQLRGEAPDDAPVFVGRGGAPLSASQVWRVVKAAGKRAGVPLLSPHWLRHALASHALEDGADIALVRDTLGHTSLATTSRYVHARPNDSAGLHLRPLPVV